MRKPLRFPPKGLIANFLRSMVTIFQGNFCSVAPFFQGNSTQRVTIFQGNFRCKGTTNLPKRTSFRQKNAPTQQFPSPTSCLSTGVQTTATTFLQPSQPMHIFYKTMKTMKGQNQQHTTRRTRGLHRRCRTSFDLVLQRICYHLVFFSLIARFPLSQGSDNSDNV